MKRAMIFGITGVAVAALAGAAWAQSTTGDRATPSNFNYEIKDGKRVPKASNRVVNADGSWREETRQGKCVTIKEGTGDGAIKTTRKCD